MESSLASFSTPFVITDKEFNAFHLIDRKLFYRLIITLGRDPNESVYVMGFWLWLEQDHMKDLHIIHRILYNVDLPSLDQMADETVFCMALIQNDSVHPDLVGCELRSLQQVLKRPLSLPLLHANRSAVLRNVSRVISEVCVRAFRDIIRYAAENPIRRPVLSNYYAAEQQSGHPTGHQVYMGHDQHFDHPLGQMGPMGMGHEPVVDPMGHMIGMQLGEPIVDPMGHMIEMQLGEPVVDPMSHMGPMGHAGAVNVAPAPAPAAPQMAPTMQSHLEAEQHVLRRTIMVGSHELRPQFYAPTGFYPAPAAAAAAYQGHGFDAQQAMQMGHGQVAQVGFGEEEQRRFVGGTDQLSEMFTNNLRFGNYEEEEDDVSADKRTIFLTFSKGYPISEYEVREFFTRRFGDIIEAIYMQEVQGDEQVLYARVVAKSRAMVDRVVEGGRAKYYINGKHVCARKYVRNSQRSPPRTGGPSESF